VVGPSVAVEVRPESPSLIARVQNGRRISRTKPGARGDGAGGAPIGATPSNHPAVVGLAVRVEIGPANARVIAPVEDYGRVRRPKTGAGGKRALEMPVDVVASPGAPAVVGLAVRVEIGPANARVIAPVED